MIELKEYIKKELHRTKILIIGVGGTGTAVLRELVSLQESMKLLDKKPFNITIQDNDIIEAHNIGKQSGFYPPDIGKKKAIILAERYNRTFGTDISAETDFYKMNRSKYDFVISCVDNVNTRRRIHEAYKKESFYAWIDLGNSKYLGQIFMSVFDENHLTIIDKYPNLKEPKGEPSCSAFQSLSEQSFAVNRFVAVLFIHMFSEFIINQRIDYNEIFFNLEKMQISKNKV